MLRDNTPDWNHMAQWAQSDVPESDDYSDMVTGDQARQVGQRFLRGRPSVGQDHATGRGRSVKRSTRLDQQTDARLLARAAAENTSVSELIRRLLRQGLA